MKHILFTCAVLLFLQSCTPPAAVSPPNIIYILADDLGYGDLGSYGQEVIQTPWLDQMASEGLRFTDHYAGSTVCAPSRCALMTGLHTGHCRIRGNGLYALLEDDVTVAEALKEAGYATGVIGKWGLGQAGSSGIPNLQGFDYFYGYLDQVRAHNFYPDWLWRDTLQVPLKNVVQMVSRGAAAGRGSYATEKVEYSHDLFAAEALAFVDRHQDQPFFLYLAYTIPHANNQARHGGMHGMEVPDYGVYEGEDWEEVHKGTAAMISRLDRDVGRLLDHLSALGLARNTLVVFSSDNGPHRAGGRVPEYFGSSGPLRGIKRDLYEGGIRVPMIAWWPGTVEPGRTTSHVSASWDFFATAQDLARLPLAADTDGISFLPTLLGQDQPSHDYLYWEYHAGRAPKQAVRYGPYKAVHFRAADRTELYDLRSDIGELHNLTVENETLADSLYALMRVARTPSEQWPIGASE